MDDHKYYEEQPDERGSSSADDSPRFRYHPDSPGSQGGNSSRHYGNGYDYGNGNGPYGRPPMRPRANPLAIAAFVVSIVSFVACCCYPNFLMIGSFIALALAICSKIFYRDTPLHGLAIAAIIIACVGIVENICLLILSYIWLPQYLQAHPEDMDEIHELFRHIEFDFD